MPRRQRWVAFALALLVLLQVPGILPLVFAGVAWVDGEHEVELDNGDEGFQLVLRHDPHARAGTFHAFNHQHCLATQVLVAFSTAPVPQERDHVIGFSAAQTAPLDGKKEQVVKGNAFAVAIASDNAALAESYRQPILPLASRPPPSAAATSFFRQTVLLI